MQKKILFLILLLTLIMISILNIKIYIEIKSNEKYLSKQLEIEILEEEQIAQYYEQTELEEVNNNQTFYKIKFCTDKYFNTIFNITNNNAENKLLNIIAEDYKAENNITKDNIKEKFTIFKHDKTIINKAYQYNAKEDISMYLLSGYNICNDGSNKKAFKIMLVIDSNQNTFEVYPDEYLDNYRIDNIINKVKKIEKIEKNENNEVKIPVITNEEIAQYYFDSFIFNIKYDIEVAYSMLNEEYKEKRFSKLQDFKEYREYRKEIYNTDKLKDYTEFEDMEQYMLYLAVRKDIEMEGYQVYYEDGYTRYICLDNYNNYYIFYVTNPFNFSVVLDTYTLGIPEFNQKYELGTAEEKVGYNIEKIVEALNGNDYKYIYGRLAGEFKENYFKTYEDFENYAKNTFDIGNEIQYNKYTESQNLCTYQITLTGRNKKVTKTIVMRLEEGTDFVFAFNVE